MTGDMDTASLYKVKEQISRLDALGKKIEKSISDIEKLGCLSPQLSEAIAACTSAAMLEQVTAAYKPGKKKSKAEQARNLGLGSVAEQLLNGGTVNFSSLVGSHENLKSVKSVVDGTKDVLVDVVRNNKFLLEKCEEVSKANDTFIECSKSKSKQESDEKKEKFDQYFDFKKKTCHLKPFQVMAINRGENLKALAVKVVISHRAENSIRHECMKVLVHISDLNLKKQVVDDACSRLIIPLVCRRTRSWLTEAAVESSIDVFAENLKHLLLTRPVKGISIMAIDPGYRHGCKVAVLDRQGNVLRTDVVYLQLTGSSAVKASRFRAPDERKLQQLQSELGFETIAIGNGTACRETETSISVLIKEGILRKGSQYTVVDERGASVYSVTQLAQEEFPNMDPNLRSAVSIGRRVLEPLSEYVKIEPQHLGVGQYQHDIAQKKLSSRLEETVSEAVSFTGVDINTCGLHMLQKISGLTKARAQAILDARKTKKFFHNRSQIKDIKGIGPKSYEQCIGFLRIYPSQITNKKNDNIDDEDAPGPAMKGKRKKTGSTSKSKLQKLDICYLDQTSVHPESYHIARSLLQKQRLKQEDIGTEKFVRAIQKLTPGDITSECGESTKQLILTSLSQLTENDYRDQFARPVFKSSVVCAESLTIGTELEGRVSNVTHFGAFVDVGLERDGLIHVSKMGGQRICLGNRVRVRVDKRDHKGIGLCLLQIM